MQIYDNDGMVSRELEDWEVQALEEAQKAHDDAAGIIRQYPQSKVDEILRGILANMADLDDYDAMRMVSAYPAWKPGVEYEEGWRVRYEGSVWTVKQKHTSADNWKPGEAVSLYAQILPGQSGSEAANAEWAQPDSTNPYMTGDVVTHNGKTWRSTVDNNVWEPGVAGWEEISDGVI